MSQTKKTYTLGKIKQLIDLNGDSTNFDLSFTITCQDETPFQILVVDQTTLDNTPELQYKQVTKTISGNIVNDKNVYQNYFLILKSDTPCMVDVELVKKDLPKTPDSAMGGVGDGIGEMPLTAPTRRVSTPPPSSIDWKKIGLIALVVIAGLCLLWWLYKRKSNSEEPVDHNMPSPGLSFNPGTPLGAPTPASVYNQTPTPSNRFKPGGVPRGVSPDVMSQSSRHSSRGGGGNSLLNRLRKFAKTTS